MKTLFRISSTVVTLAVVGALLIGPPAQAQHEGHQAPAAAQPAAAPSSELVNACVASQRQGAALADRAQARLEAARQSNSATEMRAAVEELQSVLAQIRMQLQACDPVAAAVAAAQSDAHAAHQMGTGTSSPAASPATPVGQPGRSTTAPMTGVDHSKMGNTMSAEGKPKPPAAAKPATASKSTTAIDHSKTGHATPPENKAKAPAAAKPTTPAAPMDHSKMPMGGTAPKAGADHGATKADSPKLPVMPVSRIADPGCPNVVNDKNAPKATYQGKVYYFCSAKDRDEFRKDPAAYLKKRPR